MTVVEYLDFELEIGLGQGRDYPLAVLRSPGGEARERMFFPFDELALDSRLKDLQIALLRSGGGRRQTLSPQERTVQEFGQKLFEALISGEIRSRYDVSQREAAQRGLGLRLKLRIQAPELASLPWEFLYDSRRAEYLCLSTQTPLVRYIELPQVIQPLRVAPPLRILGLIASPHGLALLDTENEKERVETALADLTASGQVQIDWLEHANRRELQRTLRRGPWHILHFIGHGGFDPASDEGFIALETERGELDRLPATQLARLLADHTSLRLAVLNSCEGAQGGSLDVFSSTASLLVRRGLPAVLAMQYEITDRAAIEFARGFYEALADDLPVDAATAEARKSVSLGLTNTIEWGTPVLHMRAPDGVLFQHLSPAELARQAAEKATREQAEQERLAQIRQTAAEQAKREQAEREAEALARRAQADQELAETAYREAREKLAAEKAAREQAQSEAAEKDRQEQIIRAAQARAAREQAEREAAELAAQAAPALSKIEELKQKAEAARARVAEDQSRQMLDLGEGVTMEFVRVPAGEFWMGGDKKLDKNASADELPQHKILLDEYLIGKYPVTNQQYQVFVKQTGHRAPSHWKNGQIPPGKEQHPVTSVNWQEAVDFCQWASQFTGQSVRLPSEAEWEKAARGTDTRLYPWGDQAPSQELANYGNQVKGTTPVGQYPAGASPFGALDQAGNVWEWCTDWYAENYYKNSPSSNPPSPASGSYRVLRGGSWYSSPNILRVSSRSWNSPGNWDGNFGFRCAR